MVLQIRDVNPAASYSQFFSLLIGAGKTGDAVPFEITGGIKLMYKKDIKQKKKRVENKAKVKNKSPLFTILSSKDVYSKPNVLFP